MEILFDLLHLKNYFDPRGQSTQETKGAQERKNEKENPRKKKMWLITKQYLQPLECPEDVYPNAGAPGQRGKSFRRAVEAAKYGMKEGLLTGTFFGGSWGIFKVFNDSFVVREDRKKVTDGKSKKKDSSVHNESLQDDAKKRSLRPRQSDEFLTENSHYNFKDDDRKNEERKIAGVMKEVNNSINSRNTEYAELLSRHGADSYDPNKFSYKKRGEKIEIVGYSFIKTTGSMTAKNSVSGEDDKSDDSDSQRSRAAPSRDKDTGPSKNKPHHPEVQIKSSNFKEKASNMTRLDVIEESQSTKTIKDNLACLKDRLLCKTASNKILHTRCFRTKENKAPKESHSPGKGKFDGFHIHRGLKSKTETHKERRNEENVYPRFGHKFSYLVDVDLIGNGYLSDIEVNTTSKTQGRTSNSKRHESKGIHPKSAFGRDRSQDHKGYPSTDSHHSRPSYLGESDQSIQKESHTMIKRSIITELKKEKSNSTISKGTRAQLGELHRQRSFSVTPEDGTSHYRDLNKQKSYTIGSEESTQISNHSYTIRTPPDKPSVMERGERTTVVPEDIIPLLDKIPKQRSYIISSEKVPPGGGISNQESIGHSEIQRMENYPSTPEGRSLQVNDTSRKERGPPYMLLSPQESQYGHSKEKGPPYVLLNAKDGKSGYKKDKGPQYVPMSAADGQSGPNKEKAPTQAPKSSQDSKSGYRKDKGPQYVPLSGPDGQSGYSKEREPVPTPQSAQDSQPVHIKEKAPPYVPLNPKDNKSGYSKDKGPQYVPLSGPDGQSGYSIERGPVPTPQSAQDGKSGNIKEKAPPYVPLNPKDNKSGYSKDKGPQYVPMSGPDSQYGYGKGSQYVPTSAPDSQSGYSKDKGPQYVPMGAPDTQSGYSKDKGPQYVPLSAPDTQSGYSKDKGPQYVPMSAPDGQSGYDKGPQYVPTSAPGSQSGYSKDKGPQYVPLSAQDTKYGYSKDKGPQYVPMSGPDSQYGYGKGSQYVPKSAPDSQSGYSKDKGPQYVPMSGPDSQYGYGKGSQYVPTSAPDSQSGYSKDKGPQYVPMSAPDSQSGYIKEKGLPYTPMSAQDSQYSKEGVQFRYSKEGGTPYAPLSAQDSQYSKEGVQSGHSKEKEPAHAAMRAQDSSYAYSKEKGAAHKTVSVQDSQFRYSKEKEPSYAPVSVQDSQSRYSKEKEPSYAPVSVQDSQSRYNKEKEPTHKPVSVQDSQSRYSKEKEPSYAPVSVQDSQSRYSKEKEPTHKPVSVQDSQSRYSKEKEPTHKPVSVQDGQSRYSKEKEPTHKPVSVQDGQSRYSKEKGPIQKPMSAQESHYAFGKEQGPPYTPINAQDSHYAYSKGKEPSYAPVSAQDGQSRYSKEKESIQKPMSAQDSHYAFGKEQSPPYTPINAQDSHYAYNREREPSYAPVSAQESQYGYTETSTPMAFIPPPAITKSSKRDKAPKTADREVVSAEPISETKGTGKQKKGTKVEDKREAPEAQKQKTSVVQNEKSKSKTYDLKAPDTISETNEIDQRSYVLSSEFGSYVRSERTHQEPDFISSPTVVEPYRKASESTLEKEFKALDKKFEPDSVSGYFDIEREISHSPLEESLRARSIERNISNFLKSVFSSQGNTPSRKSLVGPGVKTEVTAVRAEASPVASVTSSRSFQDNMILFGACNAAIILGILCSVLSCTRAYLAG